MTNSSPLTILALETANERCSVAVRQAGQVQFFEQHQEARMQTQQILPMIERALKQTHLTWQEIDCIAFSRGPGAFSGVRINAAVAQALAWANDLPVVAVSTLQAIAQNAYHELGVSAVSVSLDARMQEVYFANFQLEAQVMRLYGEEQLLNYTLAEQQSIFTPVGNGIGLLEKFKHTPEANVGQHIFADAKAIAEIAEFMAKQGLTVSPEHALPVYLRDNAWKKIAEQKTKSH